MKKEKLLVIVGPTAVGKTALSIHLAKELKGEIISGDSMQVYRGMDIGTAKILPDEMEELPHYLIDTHNPDDPFSAADFQQEAVMRITDINQRGMIPMIVGGTGLYIQSVIYQYEFSEATSDPVIRMQLEEFADKYGKEKLHERLAEIDPVTAGRLHPNDLKRVIRALEIHEITGTIMAEYQKRAKQSPYQLCLIGLTMDREMLYERINQRVDMMIEQGLVAEVEHLLRLGYNKQLSSMQAIGYKEIIEYIEKRLSFVEAVELLKKNSRNFAKRQLTWFRSMPDIHWFDLSDRDKWEQNVENIRSFVAGMLEVDDEYKFKI